MAILTGNYRRDEAALPEIRTEAMIAVLAEYPDDCIRYVTDPRTGIQSFHYTVFDHNGREVKGKFKGFPPEPGEVQEACEKYMGPIRRREEMLRLAREQTEESRRLAEVHTANEAARPALIAAIARCVAATEQTELAAAIDEAARRLSGQIEHSERVRRVEEECEQRRARREASAA